MKRCFQCLITVLCLAACATPQKHPVKKRSKHKTVKAVSSDDAAMRALIKSLRE